MIIRNISLVQFRNHSRASFQFSPGKNLIYGPNGSGKTSLLEAVYLMVFGKSFLHVPKSRICTHGKRGLGVQASVIQNNLEQRISISYSGEMRIEINGTKTPLSSVNQVIYCLLFPSLDNARYLERRMYRRKLINRFIFGLEDLYLNTLLDYNRTVKKKNILLKQTVDRKQLYSWNRVLSDFCSRIVKYRVDFVGQMNQCLGHLGHSMKIRYIPSFDLSKGVTGGDILKQMEERCDRETRERRSLIGVHLDNFVLEYRGRDLNTFSSGEKKINMFLLFAAMLHLYYQKRKEYPVLLIDDFTSALDNRGIHILLSTLPDIQIIASNIKRFDGFDANIPLSKEN